MTSRAKGPSAVHLLLFNELDQLLMIQRTFEDLETDNSSKVMTVPAGHVDVGEFPTEALIREANEELGIQIAKPDIEFTCVMHRIYPDQRTNYFFTIRNYIGTPENLEPEKCDHLTFVDYRGIDSLPPTTINYVKETFLAIEQGMRYIEY